MDAARNEPSHGTAAETQGEDGEVVEEAHRVLAEVRVIGVSSARVDARVPIVVRAFGF
jgi:hypothetical protein